ncbi:MAG TPA: hypothetical protein VIO12_03200 [Thermoanaerobaculia bacterium]|jgi:hypothetical protein
MSPTAHLLVWLAGALLAVVAFVALAYDKRRRQAAAPPVNISRARSEPLFSWSGNGEYRGFRYFAGRARILTGRDDFPTDRASETIVLESPPARVRFLVDALNVYRGVSDLFHAVKLEAPIAAPDLAPFWRSDEPERLQVLARDERFARILTELRTAPDFAALAVASTEDGRISTGKLGRAPNRDALFLTRSGFEVPYRDDHDVERDLEILTSLRELLLSMSFSDALERALVPSTAATYAKRAFRTVGVLFVTLAALLLFLIFLTRNCA